MAIMGIVAGPLSMGRIERVAGCCIATRFWMINGVPLRALDSFVDLEGLNGAEPIPIPLNERSVAAGFLRPWTAILAGVFFCGGAVHLASFVPAALLVALSAYLWLFFGRLPPSEVRRRFAYATWLGAPFDPAHLSPDMHPPCWAALKQLVDERIAQAPVGYRAQLREPWRAAALDASEPDLLVAALTRARLERRGASPEEKAELDALHAALWAKLDPLLAAGNAPRAFLDWQEHGAREQRRNRIALRHVIPAVLALMVGMAVLTLSMTYDALPTLAIVNVSGADGLTVLLDGKPVAERLPTARREGDRAFMTTRVKDGPHELVARDATGAEIDRRPLVVTAEHSAFLYAPGRAPGTCFFRELIAYSDVAQYRGYDSVRLDPTHTLSSFERRVDYWFEAAPHTVKVRRGSPAEERRTIRVKPCATAKADP
jgi:hypothetical protein